MDFSKQQIIIKYEEAHKDDHEKNKFVEFKYIVDVYRVMDEYETKLQSVANKDFNLPFMIKTHERTHELYCSIEEERKLWMLCIKYIIQSAKCPPKVVQAPRNKTVKFVEQPSEIISERYSEYNDTS